MLEVEFKARAQGLAALRVRAEQLGFRPGRTLHEADTYYNNPGLRDFRKTDEALRLRRTGDTCLLTYKGPKLDELSSSRREIEFSVGDGELAAQLLEALDFQPVFTVEKQRQELTRSGITLCLDTVAGLGEFLEAETLVREDREEAEKELLTVLHQLGVDREQFTRKSYLELLEDAQP